MVRYRLPAHLGRWIFIPDRTQFFTKLMPGTYEGEFPFSCEAGIYGDDPTKQTTPMCAGACPK